MSNHKHNLKSIVGFTIRIPVSLADQLTRVATETADSRNTVVKRALADWLRRRSVSKRKSANGGC